MKTSKSTELFHGLLLATAFAVAAHRIALTPGLIAGAVGAVFGTLLAARLLRLRYRTWVILAVGLGIVGFGALVTSWFLGSEAIAVAASPTLALRLGEVLRWGTLTWGLATALRAAAVRFRAALALEGSIVVLAVVTTIAAHRDGMIARPLEISDWFWRQGIDPVIAFLGVGLGGAVLLAGVLAYGRSKRRTLVQLLLVLLLGFFLASRIHGTDSVTPAKNAVGQNLEKNKDDKRSGQGGGQGSGQNKNDKKEDDLPQGGQQEKSKPSAIVVFHRDVTPSSGIFYFRHGAFSQFNGARLIESTLAGVGEDARHDFPFETRPVPGVHNDGDGRTEVATDVALLTPHSRMFALTDATEVAPMPNPEPARFRRAYRVVSQVLTEDYEAFIGMAPGSSDWSDEIWAHYTEAPHDERYHDLARELQSQLRPDLKSDPLALAFVVKRYLEKNATYSFKNKYAGSDDPTADFLFSEDKRGYCVHLAHAEAYLVRALGVPARVSAGYGVPAENLAGGSALLIKSGDAHAWAEIYLEGVGWIPIEVTPEKTDVEPSPFQEKDLQQLLGEMARKEGRTERASYSGPKLGELLEKVWAAVPYFVLVLVLLAYCVKLWRLAVPILASEKKAARLAYRAALDRCSAVGHARRRGEPPERFARRIETIAPSLEALTGVHVGTALGSRAPLAAGKGRSVRSLSSDVGREVRQSTPWWRWLLGGLNPIAWWWSR
ncbi:MAG: transglutaminase-like domain-containing protein [Deltaproteobacteria bacterium]